MTDIKELEKRVADGDPDAMFEVALAYREGIGVEQDLVKAGELFKKCFPTFLKRAEAGDLKAMWITFGAYVYGLGVGIDEEKSQEWLARASEKEQEG